MASGGDEGTAATSQAMLLDRLVVLYVLVAIAALVGVGFFMCVGCLLDENMLVYVLS